MPISTFAEQLTSSSITLDNICRSNSAQILQMAASMVFNKHPWSRQPDKGLERAEYFACI